MASGSQPGSRRSDHRCLDKDPGTCCVCTRGSMRSPCSTRIPADILRKGYPHSRGGRRTSLPRSVPYTLRSVRRGTARRGSVFPGEAAPLKGTKSWAVRQKQSQFRNDNNSETQLLRQETPLPCCTTHCVNGSPVKPAAHTHVGVWLTTRHSALAPQDPGQGSRHFRLIQARWLAHSLLLTHSGRQLGGEPV